MARVEQIEKPENGSWLCLSEPTDVELATVASQTGIDLPTCARPWMTRNVHVWTSKTITR